MRKTFGIVGIAAILLSGCGSATAENDKNVVTDETPAEPSAVDASEPETLRIFGSLGVDGDNSVLMGENEESCMVASPELSVILKYLETTEVTIEDAEDSIVAETEFQTDFSDDVCIWYIETEIEADSDYYTAHFWDMSTPDAAASEAVDGTLEIDLATPVVDKADVN